MPVVVRHRLRKKPNHVKKSQTGLKKSNLKYVFTCRTFQKNKFVALPLNSRGTSSHSSYSVSTRTFGICRYGLPDKFGEKMHQALSKKTQWHFSARFWKSQDTSLIVCANRLQKKPNIEEKKPKSHTFFWRQQPRKKTICEIWRQKNQCDNPVYALHFSCVSKIRFHALLLWCYKPL